MLFDVTILGVSTAVDLTSFTRQNGKLVSEPRFEDPQKLHTHTRHTSINFF